ncbi:solute carrier family 35 member C2 [Aplysia californica]|uniref:Solute carrier family 35 member C2 n=1 Tax=Aplysia californica TaxID=6500 RepID=A0ABM0JEW2_APLCA|nr:solute carrier family 35 member C2 [Aplysia californica]
MGKKVKAHHRDLREFKAMVAKQEERVKTSMCSMKYLQEMLVTLALILFMYIFSIGLTFYNRYLFKNSSVTLSITLCHFVFKFVASSIIRLLLECKNKEPRVMLDWKTYCKRVAAAGIVGSLDIGFSNWSFEFITISLYVMSKTTSVIFILIFSLVLRLEKFRWSLILVVLCIFSGLFLFTFHSTQFNLEGFILVMMASVLSGLRWTLAQIVLQKKDLGLQNPLDMMYHIQPWMILALFPLSAGMEGVSVSSSSHYFGFYDWSTLMSSLGMIMIGAGLSFMLELSEFLLVCHTSSLTLSISGIFKELCAFVLAVLINHDETSLLNGVGVVICLLGIVLHVVTKAVYGKESEEVNHKVNGSVETVEMLRRDGSANQEDTESDEVDLFSVERDR